jgi:hypothetical protein
MDNVPYDPHDLQHDLPHAVSDPGAVVIAIAATAAERLHLAALVSDHAPVLLVGSREEALAVLQEGSPEPLVVAEPVMAPGARAVVADPWPDPQPLAPTPGRPVLVVDSDLREARWLDRRVPLSPLEHDVMVHLVRHLGRTLTFEHLHREVWGTDHFGGGGDVQSVVKRLRRKLHHLGSSLRIQPVRGVGLRLVDTGEAPAG